MKFDLATTNRLKMNASNNGFDLDQGVDGEWLAFASSQTNLKIWLTALGDSLFLVAFSRRDVSDALVDFGTPFTNPLPQNAVVARGVKDQLEHYKMLRRAFQLSRSLPTTPLEKFRAKTRNLPKTTEAQRLVIQRVGQDIFRQSLMDYWDGQCAITGFTIPELLRASHIKPWAACETDEERLDVHNGILLAPHMDAIFDKGYITIDEKGCIQPSRDLDQHSQNLLNLKPKTKIKNLTKDHQKYLIHHRTQIFRGYFERKDNVNDND